MRLPFPEAVEPDDAMHEAGRKMFAGETDFVKGVVAMDGLPDPDRPEVCFAGRSNVGKSSLINALTGRKGLARASNTPGRTQEINYFTVGESHFLVDLPAMAMQTRQSLWLRNGNACSRVTCAGDRLCAAPLCWSTPVTGSNLWMRKLWRCSARPR